MMRIDVDFNERDRDGHVVTRVPAEEASRLVVGQHVNLYDPPEKLWADAVVTRVNPVTHIAAFDVDWHSFVDADVTDITGRDSQWSIGVPPAAGMTHVATFVGCSAKWSTTWVKDSPFRGVIVAGDLHENIASFAGTANALSWDESMAS